MKIEDKDVQEFLQSNRAQLFAGMPANSIAIVYAAKEQLRSNDIHYPFNQNRNFRWLTGLDEPDAIAVFTKDQQNNSQYTLFTLPLDPLKEQFSAARIGTEKAKSLYSANEAYELSEFPEKIKALLHTKSVGFVATTHIEHEATRTKLFAEMLENRQRPPSNLQDIDQVLARYRLLKSDFEIARIRAATQISMAGHLRAMAKTAPGKNESDIQRTLENAFRKLNCKEQSYGSIVAAGTNSYFLHYTANNAPLKAGDLLLIDAAAEQDGITSDITTTFPISSTFSPAQKEIYNCVLKANKEVFAAAQIGAPFSIMQETAIRVLTTEALKIGLLKGDLETLIKDKAIRRFYPHGCGHWLGWDVHDVGPYLDDEGQSTKLQANMIFTNEPGLYIPQNAEDVDAKWRGIGVRIEDVILMTPTGPENLCAGLPRTVEDIENFIRTNRIDVTPKLPAREYTLKEKMDYRHFFNQKWNVDIDQNGLGVKFKKKN